MSTANAEQMRPEPPLRSGYAGPVGVDVAHPVKLTWGFIKFSIGRWWRLAVPIGVLFALIGAAIMYFVVGPSYETEAWLRIEDLKPSLAFANPDSPRFINTQIELVRSPLVLGPVLAQPEIAKLDEILEEPHPQTWLAEQVAVRSVGGSELYKIVLATSKPTNGPLIVNAILDSYLKIQTDFQDMQSQRTVELLDQELQRRSAELERMQRNLKDLARQVTGQDPALLVNAKDKAFIARSTNPIDAINERLAETESSRQILEAEQTAVKELLERNQTPITAAMIEEAVEKEPEMMQLRGEIKELDERIHQVSALQGLGGNHPQVKTAADAMKRAQQRVEPLRERLSAAVVEKLKLEKRRQQEESLSRLTVQVSTHGALEDLLKEKLKKQREELQVLGDHSLELEFARSELVREESVFEKIAERSAALRTEMRAPGRVTPLKRSTATDVKLTRDPLQRVLLVSLLGFIAPFGLAILWERRVRRVADSSQVARDANLEVIAEISDLPQLVRGRNKPSLRYERQRAMYEESVDLLRNSLTLPDKNKELRVMSLCSAVSGEGKTSLSCQLAVSLARAAQSPVVLIDGDMRAPDVHRRFDVELGPGFSEVLSGEAALGDCIHKWTENVHLVTAGKLRKSPHTLVNHERVSAIISELREQYRYIVIDCPPLLAASEAFVMAKASDGALLCAMRDVSKALQVRFAGERLLAANVRCLGLVLNGVRSEDYGYRYGGYSHYAITH
jgi:capsular exopolysaccharide synthesis family protein